MDELFFRFFCHVTSPGHELGDLSFKSLLWLKERGLVRVLPLRAVHIRVKSPKSRPPVAAQVRWWNPWTWRRVEAIELEPEPEQNRWEAHEDDFMRPVPDQFVNVVCGTGEEAGRVHTANVINIAIVLPGSDHPEGFRIIENEKQLEEVLLSRSIRF